ncbi:MAG: hypothetical protein K0S53_2051 [Bacteroidetes bacterium]|jgi:hypothetical protein|nr:hypothetical protein [Bacteroidota bacterium]MDF2452842.1 hypothetical protein [Bacteroidota bacterium]
MKTPNLIIRIPEPCHEDWNSMQPDTKGKFCSSCSKAVFDFSNKTDDEITDILLEYKEQKVCGHFKKSQVNRPLNIKVNLNDLPKNISLSKAFVIAVFLVFGSFLFSCKDEQGHTLGDIGFEVPKNEEPIEQLYAMGSPSFQIHDSLQRPVFEDTVIVEEGFVEGMMTGDIAYVEEYVDGGLMLEEKKCEEVPTNVVTTLVQEEMIGGQMIMPYVEKTDSVIGQKDTTSNIGSKTTTENTISKTAAFGIYPNPANGEFTITYELNRRSDVKIDITNVSGIVLRTVSDVIKQYEGHYRIPVNLNELSNGIYLVTLVIDNQKLVERLVIEK